MLEIDGSRKSGSGTIVRDVMSLAALTQTPVKLRNIRAKRSNPGLRPQHVKCVQAAARISNGHATGDSVHSDMVTFHPGEKISGGEFTWDIGTAGSTTMLAMSLIPMALFADRDSTYTIRGGLFQDFAPGAFYLQHVFLPAITALGAKVHMSISRPGYVPEGGGEIVLTIHPITAPLQPVQLQDQGEIDVVKGIAFSSHLKHALVSDRMADSCQDILHSDGFQSDISVCYDSNSDPYFDSPAKGAGAALAIWTESSSGCVFGADMAGARGRPSEHIGEATAHSLLEDIRSGATVDRFLADQLIPYAALANGTTLYRIPHLTDHIESRLWLIQEFLNAESEINNHTLKIHGVGLTAQ